MKKISKKPLIIPISTKHYMLNTKKEVKEQMEERLKDKLPTQKTLTTDMVNWMRRRYDNKSLQKSLLTLLPDNGKPVVSPEETEEEKKLRLQKEFLQEYLKQPSLYDKTKILPKYLFDKETFEKIVKLKQIFLSFDEDGSREMEINEMLDMFKSNNINVTYEDLISLFFADEKFREKDMMKLHYDFYRFVRFALSKDELFRSFIRNLKEKSTSNGFLPVSFKILFDYFSLKQKERESKNKIKDSMNVLERYIKKDENDKDILPNKEEDQLANYENILSEFSTLVKAGNERLELFGEERRKELKRIQFEEKRKKNYEKYRKLLDKEKFGNTEDNNDDDDKKDDDDVIESKEVDYFEKKLDSKRINEKDNQQNTFDGNKQFTSTCDISGGDCLYNKYIKHKNKIKLPQIHNKTEFENSLLKQELNNFLFSKANITTHDKTHHIHNIQENMSRNYFHSHLSYNNEKSKKFTSKTTKSLKKTNFRLVKSRNRLTLNT